MSKSPAVVRKIHSFALVLVLVLSSLLSGDRQPSTAEVPYRFDIAVGEVIRLDTECYFGNGQLESRNEPYRFDIGEGAVIQLECRGYGVRRPKPIFWNPMWAVGWFVNSVTASKP